MSNEHYVPRLYLKNFAFNDAKSLVYSYKKGEKTKPKSIKKVASEKDYYTINEGEHAKFAKNNNDYLFKIESNSEPIIRNILERLQLPNSRNDRITLAYFVATLATRTPLIHEYFKKQVIDDAIKTTKMSALDVNEFYSFVRSFEKRLTDEDIEKIRLELLEPEKNLVLTVDDSDHNKSFIRSLLSVAHSELLVRNLFSSFWHLLVINSDKFFITSDNPVVFLYPRPFEDKNHFILASPIFLPISPRIGLLIHPWKFAQDKIYIEDESVDFYINQSILSANELVFSHTNSKEIKFAFDNRQRDLGDLNFQFNFMNENELKFLIKNKMILKDLFDK